MWQSHPLRQEASVQQPRRSSREAGSFILRRRAQTTGFQPVAADWRRALQQIYEPARAAAWARRLGAAS